MRFLYAALSLVVLLSSCASSQTKRPVYSLSGGVALPSQPWELKHYWDAGLHVSGGIGYPLTKHLTIRAMFSYSHFPFDAEAVIERDDAIAPWIKVEGSPSTALTTSCQLEISFVDRRRIVRLSPYCFIGPCFHYQVIGAYTEWTRATHIGSEWYVKVFEQKVSSLGVEFGGGLAYRLTSRFSVNVEAGRSVGLSTEPSCGAWIPVRVGLIFQ